MNKFLVAGLLGLGVMAGAKAEQTNGFGIDLSQNSVEDCDDGCDNTNTGFRLSYAHGFNENFTLEVDYQSFGEATYSYEGGFESESVSWEASAFDVFARGNLPAGSVVTFFGKAGLSLWSVDASYRYSNISGYSESDSESANGVSLAYGIGMAIKWFELAYTNHNDIGDDDTTGESSIEQWSIGGHWQF